MAKMNMKAITMAFKEVLLDEEGNPVKDNEGKTVYVRVFRKVRHNAAYFPPYLSPLGRKSYLLH